MQDRFALKCVRLKSILQGGEFFPALFMSFSAGQKSPRSRCVNGTKVFIYAVISAVAACRGGNPSLIAVSFLPSNKTRGHPEKFLFRIFHFSSRGRCLY
ncbi:hypothetical protein [Candidatus Avelusimicrobium facis]|uniref:hypothetical protein n=1 Tax=Candidatus Avelusimicrobium facis TaxID=3416203 RepID=UPI003D10F197